MSTYLKYKYMFFHFELRSDPESDFFSQLSRIRIPGFQVKNIGSSSLRNGCSCKMADLERVGEPPLNLAMSRAPLNFQVRYTLYNLHTYTLYNF